MPSKISSIDLFSILSVSIGLVADVITISSIMFFTRSSETASYAIWLLTVVSIIITVILIGFLGRRLLVNRAKKKTPHIDKAMYSRIENGISVFSLTSGTILGTTYSIALSASINADTSKAGSVVIGLIIGLIISVLVSIFLDQVAKEIYKAFDLDYSD